MGSVRYVPEFLLRVPSTGDQMDLYLLEPRIKQAFVKYNNNVSDAGTVNPRAEGERAQAFSHWTYVATRQQLMVVDLQGCNQGTHFTLTDPAINAPANQRRFPATNWGAGGVLQFFGTHSCGPTCSALGLAGGAAPASCEAAASWTGAASSTYHSMASDFSSYASLRYCFQILACCMAAKPNMHRTNMAWPQFYCMLQ